MGKKYLKQSRYGHVGKSAIEKENYRKLINTPQEKINDTLSKTKEDFGYSDITDSTKESISNIHEIKPKERKPRIKKPYKSTWTIITENIKNVIFGVIVFGIITVCVGIVWGQQRELGKIDANINSITKDVEKLQDKYSKTIDDGSNSNNSIYQIKVDLEYIKERLKKIETKAGL